MAGDAVMLGRCDVCDLLTYFLTYLPLPGDVVSRCGAVPCREVSCGLLGALLAVANNGQPRTEG